MPSVGPDIFEAIAEVRRRRLPAALATVIGTKGSTPAKMTARMLVRADGTQVGTIGGGCIEADVIRDARDVMDTGRPVTRSFHLHGEEAERTGIACGGIVTIMIESLDDPRVVLIGAGHVAQATAVLAKSAGFRVTIVDNGRNLELPPGDGLSVRVIPNPNLGGAGGFARGLMHARNDGWTTHVLFMDDDITMEVESVVRAIALFRYATDPRLCVHGAMISEEIPWMQFEAGSHYAWPDRRHVN